MFATNRERCRIGSFKFVFQNDPWSYETMYHFVYQL